VTTIGSVAAELGLSVEALRYYERAGLSAPVRDSGGRRDYSDFDVDQLRLVTGLRAVGIPIESIRQLLSAKVQEAPSRANADRALDQLAAMDAVLRGRQAEIRAARRLIRGWADQIQDWLGADAGIPGSSQALDPTDSMQPDAAGGGDRNGSKRLLCEWRCGVRTPSWRS